MLVPQPIAAQVPAGVTSTQIKVVQNLLSISNCLGHLTIGQFIQHFGVPNDGEPWGDRIWEGLHNWMLRLRGSHPQRLTLGTVGGYWGWYWNEPGCVSKEQARSPLPDCDITLQCYPCWYYVDGRWCRMLCFALIVWGSRMWWVYPARIMPLSRM